MAGYVPWREVGLRELWWLVIKQNGTRRITFDWSVGSAPRFSSSAVASARPNRAARCNGVSPADPSVQPFENKWSSKPWAAVSPDTAPSLTFSWGITARTFTSGRGCSKLNIHMSSIAAIGEYPSLTLDSNSAMTRLRPPDAAAQCKAAARKVDRIYVSSQQVPDNANTH
jgi:hypothetical protein